MDVKDKDKNNDNIQKIIVDDSMDVTISPYLLESLNISDITSYLLTEFNNHYKIKSKHNRWLKIVFFIITFAVIIGVIACLLYSVIKAAENGVNGYVITFVISSLVSLLTTIISLPLIIANYLFPKDEDAEFLGLVYKIYCKEKGIDLSNNEDI